jgi:hypothetical protein
MTSEPVGRPPAIIAQPRIRLWTGGVLKPRIQLIKLGGTPSHEQNGHRTE